ncbi:hypothetical protein FNH22_16415 [Fulvivirga sp. M361]|uniref:hypothetical protein n=1 Tax=Fulvivirga sp. M361 TaxID=2594266 RepID=UPI00117998AB|nr:hypothetical protein [Fulvivirga sp. M361]TRX56221.1 hypothetical protein FNH22_16415 [Fulvivirga sp. M361]
MKKSIFFTLIIPIAFAISCNDDEESGTPLNAEQAQVSMDNLGTDMSDDVVNMIQSDGVEAMNDLFALLDVSDPFNGRLAELDQEGRKKWFKSRSMLFKTIFVPAKSVDFNRVQEDGDFDFEGNKGIYDWDAEAEEFVKSQESSDIIVINFPAGESETNNVSLRINDYTEKAIEEEDDFFPGEIDIYYVPTKISAELSVDETVQIKLDFAASYNTIGDPVSGNASLFLNPYNFTVNFDDSQSASATLSASITEGDAVITSADLTVTFQSADKEEVKEASGFVQYMNIKLQGNINAQELDTEDEDVDVNEFINLELFDGANKVGDIVIEEEEDEDGYEEEVPYVVYADGSKEKLEDILQPAIDEVDGEFDNWDFGD